MKEKPKEPLKPNKKVKIEEKAEEEEAAEEVAEDSETSENTMLMKMVSQSLRKEVKNNSHSEEEEAVVEAEEAEVAVAEEEDAAEVNMKTSHGNKLKAVKKSGSIEVEEKLEEENTNILPLKNKRLNKNEINEGHTFRVLG